MDFRTAPDTDSRPFGIHDLDHLFLHLNTISKGRVSRKGI
jgi:hypothetical protein